MTPELTAKLAEAEALAHHGIVTGGTRHLEMARCIPELCRIVRIQAAEIERLRAEVRHYKPLVDRVNETKPFIGPETELD